jgi:ribosome-associated protein
MDKNLDDTQKRPYIELNAFVCLNKLATTGGRAKLLIRSGNISVNSEKETRNKRKLYTGDIMSYMGRTYFVQSHVCRMR